MPGNALEHVDVDHVLPAAAMGALLARLAVEPAAEPPGPAPTDMEVEVEVEGFSLEAMEGEPSGLSCPDCHGVLWGIDDGGLQRFRCRVGHAWSPESLLTRQSESLEAALWVALRSLEERAAPWPPHHRHPLRGAGQRGPAGRPGGPRLLLDRDSFATAWPLIGDRQAPAAEASGG
jgi:hypothetical protein